MKYITKGTCAQEIDFDIKNGTVVDVNFIGGCQGNALGIAKLINGMKIEEVIDKLQGIKCGFKETSCPDQLAEALRNQ